MYSDRIYSPTSYTHRSASSTPRAIRRTPAIPLTSTTASSSSGSFFKGRDGIYRPQSLLSLATETTADYSYSPSSLPKTSAIPSRLSDFRAKHRTDSGYSSPKSARHNYESTFQSNFNDNLRHIRTASGYGSSNYVPSYSSTSYRFTKAYYAPKMRERPLLSNLKARFGSGRDLSGNTTPTSSLRNKSSTGTSSHHGSTTSSTSVSRHHDSVSSTGSNGNSVNSPVSSVSQQGPGPRLERNKFMIKFREHNQDQSAEKRRESIRWDVPRPCRFSKSDVKVDATIAEDEDDCEPLELLKPASPELVNDRLEDRQTSKSDVDENNNTLSRWDGHLELNNADNTLTGIEAKIETISEPEAVYQPEIVELVPVIKSESIDLKPSKPKKAVKKVKKKRDSDSDSLNVSDSSSRSREPSPGGKFAESPEIKLTPPELKPVNDAGERQKQQQQARETSPIEIVEVNIVLPNKTKEESKVLEKKREESPIETVNLILPKAKEEQQTKKEPKKSKELKDNLKLNISQPKSKSREPSPVKPLKAIHKTKSENKNEKADETTTTTQRENIKPLKENENNKIKKVVKKAAKKEPEMLKETMETIMTDRLTSDVSVVDTSKVQIGKPVLCKKKKVVSKEKTKSEEPKKLKKKKLTKELNIEKANEVVLNDVPKSPKSPRSPKSPKIGDNLPSPKKLKVSKKKEPSTKDERPKDKTKVLSAKDKKNDEPAGVKDSKDLQNNNNEQPKVGDILKPTVPKVTEPKRLRFREYCLEDFELIAVLGRGSFGKVVLAELRGYDAFFAIKALKKKTVIEDDDIESIMIERKVLAYGSNYPFICKLFCTFQNETHLFFAMEWCGGGDMMFHVQKEGKFGEDKARFYACEILCSLNFLHSRGIIYRDLKLDNIMINHNGHISLVDFGMCVGKMYREDLLPSNFCGTPEYMAPEIIKGVKYNHSVDFWAFGIVIYEMLVGCAPFNGGDEDELLWNVCNRDIHYPNHLSEDVKSLIVLLLRRDPKTRLGMSTCREGKPSQQAWFNDIDWIKVEQCKLPPPFIPQMEHAADISYFDQYFTKEKPVITSGPPEDPISDSDQELFKGFNFTNHHMTD